MLPYFGCALSFASNPREFLQRMRRLHGDTFILDMFGAKLLFVFSATGVKSLYQQAEADASFTEATRGFLGLKIPEEVNLHAGEEHITTHARQIIADGDLRKFHAVLKTPLLPGYIRHVHDVVNESIDALPDTGSVEIFAYMKSLVFQVGDDAYSKSIRG